MDRLLDTEHENERIVLGLLSSVENDGDRSQRRIAAELGIALGLVNAYLKRCIKKGLVKVHDAPARRYAYYLTPQGFAEKSRLTVEYLSSFVFVFSAGQSRLHARLSIGEASGTSKISCFVENRTWPRSPSCRLSIAASRSSPLSIKMPMRCPLSESKSFPATTVSQLRLTR